MAEVADIMTAPHQKAILPDLAAGCSMADMANLAKVERCWRELNQVLNAEEQITPVTYINSAADLKAFCGEHGGIVCTSSNAGTIAKWAFERRPKVLFFPDQHLGRWTGHNMGIPMDEMVVWDPDLELGGLTPAQINKAKILLWKGHCSVHQMFQKSHIDAFRAKHPDGLVISHPECNFDVCAASDYVGSTEYIVKTIKEAPEGALAGGHRAEPGRPPGQEVLPQNKIVQFMATTICMCSTMQRIDPQHLAWTLENLAEGKVVNQILVPDHEAVLAKLALERMLDIS
jgi:quinolinate synthase